MKTDRKFLLHIRGRNKKGRKISSLKMCHADFKPGEEEEIQEVCMRPEYSKLNVRISQSDNKKISLKIANILLLVGCFTNSPYTIITKCETFSQSN